MASKQSEANKRHYETILAPGGQPMSPEEATEWRDRQWTALTAEPGGVDYVEVDAGGTKAMWLIPKACVEDRVIFCVHGGGYIGGSIYTHRKMYAHLAKAAGCRGLVIDYDYVHQNIFPTQLNQALTAYRWLLRQGVEAKRMAMIGDSCGATILFGLLQRARDEGLPQPAAAMSISAWTDLDATGVTYETNRAKDAFFTKETTTWLARNIVGPGGDLRDPLASPLYGDLKGFPPIFLQAGGDETLLDDSRMFAERAKAAGVEVRLDVFPEMLHSFQMMAGCAPEADDAIGRLAEWVRPRLGLTDIGRKAA